LSAKFAHKSHSLQLTEPVLISQQLKKNAQLISLSHLGLGLKLRLPLGEHFWRFLQRFFGKIGHS